MDIETIRREGMSCANVKLSFESGEWALKCRHHDGAVDNIAWTSRRGIFWVVCTPSSLNPFDEATIEAAWREEEDAVAHMIALGGLATRQAA